MSSSGEGIEDWDEDFASSSSDNEAAPPTLQLKGIVATADDEAEDWDADFDFGDDESDKKTKSLKEPETKAASTPPTSDTNEEKKKLAARPGSGFTPVLKKPNLAGAGLGPTHSAATPTKSSLPQRRLSSSGSGSNLIESLMETLRVALVNVPPAPKPVEPAVPHTKPAARTPAEWEKFVEEKEKAILQALGKRDKAGASRHCYELGMGYLEQGQHAKAMNQLKQAHRHLKDIPHPDRDVRLEAQILMQIGILFQLSDLEQRDPLQADDFLRSALDIVQVREELADLLPQVHYQLGHYCRITDQHFRAANYFCLMIRQISASLESQLSTAATSPSTLASTADEGPLKLKPTTVYDDELHFSDEEDTTSSSSTTAPSVTPTPPPSSPTPAPSPLWTELGKGCLELGLVLKAFDLRELAEEFARRALESFRVDRAHNSELIAAAQTLLREVRNSDVTTEDEDGSSNASISETSTATAPATPKKAVASAPGAATTPAASAGSTTDSGSSGGRGNKTEDVEEEIENWDEEFGITQTGEEPVVLRLRFDEEADEPTVNPTLEKEGLIPSKYKLFDSTSDRGVDIIKLPQSSSLYHLTITGAAGGNDNHMMNSEMQVAWLDMLIAKHKNTYYHRASTMRSNYTLGTLADLERFADSEFATLPAEIARRYVEYCGLYYQLKHTESYEQCWNGIQSFFDRLSELPMPSDPAVAAALHDASMLLLFMAAKLWTPERDPDFTAMLGNYREFDRRPGAEWYTLIIKAETHLHHHSRKFAAVDANPLTEWCELLRGVDRELSLLKTSHASPEHELRLIEARARILTDVSLYLAGMSPLTTYMYEREDTFYEADTFTEADVFEDEFASPQATASAAAITASGSRVVPRGHGGDRRGASVDEDDSSDPFVDIEDDPVMLGNVGGPGSLANLHAASASTAAAQGEESEEGLLLSHTMRMKQLLDVYVKMPLSFYKAKAAYVLAHYILTGGIVTGSSGSGPAPGRNSTNADFRRAERLYFECLYILDLLATPVPSTTGTASARVVSSILAQTAPPMISELGCNALLRYAEVAMKNSKYLYGILAYGAALGNKQLRRKKDLHALLSSVAAKAKDNNDSKRAIKFYSDLLRKCMEENRTNEVVFVSELLATLYLEQGEFVAAEKTLKGACAIVGAGTAASTVLPSNVGKMDPRRFGLQLKLAALYLDSCHLERAIVLLESMWKALEGDHKGPSTPLPLGRHDTKRKELLVMLVKAYIKKRWYADALTALQYLELEERAESGNSQLPRASVVEALALVGDSAGATAAAASGANTADTGTAAAAATVNIDAEAPQLSSTFWRLAALNFYHSKRYTTALRAIEYAIRTCPPSSLSMLGQLFYLRGKIFQGILAISHLLKFPTTLMPNEKQSTLRQLLERQRSGIGGADAVTIYTSAGDLLQECTANYTKAYEYYFAMSDDLRICRTVARIAETYLGRFFWPVAMMKFAYEDLARMTLFRPSRLAASASTTEANGGAHTPEPARKEKKKKGKGKKDPSETEAAPAAENAEFFVSLEDILGPAQLAIDISATINHLPLLAKCLMNMAEVCHLQGDYERAMAYWRECRDLLYNLFFDGSRLIGRTLPPYFVERILGVVKRAVQFLFCTDREAVNKNLMLVDAYVQLQMELLHAVTRPRQTTEEKLSAAAKEIHEKSRSIGRSKERERKRAEVLLGSGTATEVSSASTAGSTSDTSATPSTLSTSTSDRQSVPSSVSSPAIASTLSGQTSRPSSLPSALSTPPVPSSSSGDGLSAVLSTSPSKGAAAMEGHRPSDPPIGPAAIAVTTTAATTGGAAAFADSVKPNNKLAPLLPEALNERVWGLMYKMKVAANKWISGKMSRDELQSYNGKVLRKIIKVLAEFRSLRPRVLTSFDAADAAPVVPHGTATAPIAVSPLRAARSSSRMSMARVRTTNHFREYQEAKNDQFAYDELVKRVPAVSRAVYMLLIDSHILCYLPASGQKRLLRLGGRHDQHPVALPIAPPSSTTIAPVAAAAAGVATAVPASTPTATPALSSSSVLFVRVHPMYNIDEYVAFVVSPFLSLEKVLSLVLTPASWSASLAVDTAKDRTSKKAQSVPVLAPAVTPGFMSSPLISAALGRAGSGPVGQSLKHSFRMIECTKLFLEELSKMIQNIADFASAAPSEFACDGDGTGEDSGMAAKSAADDVSGIPTRSITFAKMVQRPHELSATFLPLFERMKATLLQCFTPPEIAGNSENSPLHLYLYPLLFPSPFFEMSLVTGNSLLNGNQTVMFSEEVSEFLKKLVTDVKQEKDLSATSASAAATRAVVEELVDSLFPVLLEIIPGRGARDPHDAGESRGDTDAAASGGSLGTGGTAGAASGKDRAEAKEKGGFLSHFKPGRSAAVDSTASLPKPVTYAPLHIICSRSLHIFPWELMVSEFCVRAFSLQHIIDRELAAPRRMIKAAVQSEVQEIPQYFGPHRLAIEGGKADKSATASAMTDDKTRIDRLVTQLMFSLNLSNTPPAPSHLDIVQAPLRCPLVRPDKKQKLHAYKKKYKHVDFFDATRADVTYDMSRDYQQQVSAMVKMSSQFPVFLFTYADLLDCTQTIVNLTLRFRCTLLFIPAAKFKFVVEKLMKLQDLYLKIRPWKTPPRSVNSSDAMASTSSGTATTGGPLHTSAPPSPGGVLKDCFQMLMSIVNNLREEHAIPIVVVNPPTIYNPSAHTSGISGTTTGEEMSNALENGVAENKSSPPPSLTGSLAPPASGAVPRALSGNHVSASAMHDTEGKGKEKVKTEDKKEEKPRADDKEKGTKGAKPLSRW